MLFIFFHSIFFFKKERESREISHALLGLTGLEGLPNTIPCLMQEYATTAFLRDGQSIFCLKIETVCLQS